MTNLLARVATYPPQDPLAAPMEAHARLLAETLPGLELRRTEALAAVNRARANPALRQELADWFEAWMSGYPALPREKQREFLFALGAEVRVWGKTARAPRAQLVIHLPTAAVATLPRPDTQNAQGGQDGQSDWTMDVDLARGRDLLAQRREAEGFIPVDGNGQPMAEPTDSDPATVMRMAREKVAELYGRQATKIVSGASTHPRTGEAAHR
ncbi:MAG TPA: hypothetical protein VF808_15820 [Ktedonobacterales bacterium]